MRLITTPLAGLALLEPTIHADPRGSFREVFREDHYAALGLPSRFAQDNLVWSRPGTLRGLHLQHPRGQGKLVQVLVGEVYDVCVDVRVGSPTFGRWHGVRLSAAEGHLLYVPDGFAHGYCVSEGESLVSYKCTELHAPGTEMNVAWNDPDLSILWPVASPLVSEKDRRAPKLREIPTNCLPRFAGVATNHEYALPARAAA